MPRFIVERHFGNITDEDMLAASMRSDELRRSDFPELTWEVTHVCIGDDGIVTTFCVYEAPSEEAIRQHAAAFGMHTVDRVREIAEDVTPAALRDRLGAAGERF
jgi:hypothetical protein